MGSLTTNGKNAVLDELDNQVAFLSAHTAAPGESGTSEVTGGTYVRKAVTLAAAAAGTKSISGTVVFDIPGGTTVTHVGCFTAVTAGTFIAWDDLASSEPFGADGTLTVDDLDFSV